MTDPEAASRKSEQARAIDIHRPTGAIITHNYLERKQEFVAVNKNDLEDILGFDGMAAFFSGLGMFFLAGASWLLVDKVTSISPFQVTAPIAVCALSIVFGLATLGAGFYLHIKKRGRIQRIFDETSPSQGRPR